MPRRTSFQREKDLQDLASRYLRGEAQAVIAYDMKVSQQAVSDDLRTLRDRWRKATTMLLDEHKARELAKIDNLELTYWTAWQESRGEKSRTLTRQTKREDTLTMAQVIKEQGDGNPAFLVGVQWCIDRRCKLLGLDAPVKADILSGGKPIAIREVVIEHEKPEAEVGA